MMEVKFKKSLNAIKYVISDYNDQEEHILDLKNMSFKCNTFPKLKSKIPDWIWAEILKFSFIYCMSEGSVSLKI